MFNFGSIGNSKVAISRTWKEFRDALKNKEFNFDESWDFKANVCVVETFGEHNSKCFKILFTFFFDAVVASVTKFPCSF